MNNEDVRVRRDAMFVAVCEALPAWMNSRGICIGDLRFGDQEAVPSSDWRSGMLSEYEGRVVSFRISLLEDRVFVGRRACQQEDFEWFVMGVVVDLHELLRWLGSAPFSPEVPGVRKVMMFPRTEAG
ncbi:MAG: hypothetical protein JNK05_14260 [Myxococcales bacterium]|nr:hypothetical protein [Myxococcales bacterium]